MTSGLEPVQDTREVENIPQEAAPRTTARSALLVIAYAATWFLGGVFIFAGVLKLFDLRALDEFAAWANLPQQLWPWIGFTVGLFDVLLGTLLILNGLTRRWPLVAVVITLLGYTGVLVALHLTGSHAGCGCFGGGHEEEASTLLPIGRNLGLLGTAACALLLQWRLGR